MKNFNNIECNEFRSQIKAAIWNSKFSVCEIEIEHDSLTKEDLITIAYENFGFDGSNITIDFTIEQMEDLIAKFNAHKQKIKEEYK